MSQTTNTVAHHDTVEAALEAVRAAVQSIDYGSVLLKIHQGEVVAIETSTKLRLKDGSSVKRERSNDG
jgi:hypothetical protein